MSATSRPAPRPRLPRHRPVEHRGDAQLAIRRIATLAALALLAAQLLDTFAGIVLFVAGLATLAAYAATHPDHG